MIRGTANSTVCSASSPHIKPPENHRRRRPSAPLSIGWTVTVLVLEKFLKPAKQVTHNKHDVCNLSSRLRGMPIHNRHAEAVSARRHKGVFWPWVTSIRKEIRNPRKYAMASRSS